MAQPSPPQLIHLDGEELRFFLPKAVLQEIATDEELRSKLYETNFGMDIRNHPYFEADIEHFPFSEEERNYLIEECGNYQPKNVTDLNRMRSLLSQRPDSSAKKRRGGSPDHE